MKKKIFALVFAAILCFSLMLPVSASNSRLVDDAGLLTAEEYTEVLTVLNEISERQKFDVVVHTTNSTNGQYIRDYADDYFDYNGYGFGSSYDGAILVIDMGGRDWWISGCGRGVDNIDSSVIEKIGDEITPYLSSGDYRTGMITYAEMCDDYCNGAPYNWFFGIVISVGIGFAIALISVFSMKSKLKSVRFQPAAKDYLVPGSMNVTASRDIFLYRNVTRRAKPKENSSSHTSSSGRSHSGGGGSF